MKKINEETSSINAKSSIRNLLSITESCNDSSDADVINLLSITELYNDSNGADVINIYNEFLHQ